MNRENGSRLNQMLEVFRSKSGLSWTFFYGLHRDCPNLEKDFGETLNSREIDPASGDFKPIFQVILVCRDHNSSSVIERIQGL